MRWMITGIAFMLMAGGVFAGGTQAARGYPADLFAVILPQAKVTPNATGHQLSNGKTTIQAVRIAHGYTFTDANNRKTITALKSGEGWSLYLGQETLGRIDRTSTGASGRIGKSDVSVTRTDHGPITSSSSVNPEHYSLLFYGE